MAGLPDFDNPPVIETVLGVQFTPLVGFKTPHYGLYWHKIKQEYNHAEAYPPIPSIVEEFGRGAVTRIPQFSLEFVTDPDARCWFIDESKNNLIQVQRDSFVHNWRKVKGYDLYPHYETIRPKFRAQWLRFCEFLKEEGLAIPEVNQCEVTYVNHIDLINDVDGSTDFPKIISPWSGDNSGEFLPKPEKVLLNTSYLIKEMKGRLHISLQPVIRNENPTEVLQVNVSARGRPASSTVDDILEWLDLGREWVVRGFTDFTTPEMHALWRRKNDR